jgi:hypothetical protein
MCGVQSSVALDPQPSSAFDDFFEAFDEPSDDFDEPSDDEPPEVELSPVVDPQAGKLPTDSTAASSPSSVFLRNVLPPPKAGQKYGATTLQKCSLRRGAETHFARSIGREAAERTNTDRRRTPLLKCARAGRP